MEVLGDVEVVSDEKSNEKSGERRDRQTINRQRDKFTETVLFKMKCSAVMMVCERLTYSKTQVMEAPVVLNNLPVFSLHLLFLPCMSRKCILTCKTCSQERWKRFIRKEKRVPLTDSSSQQKAVSCCQEQQNFSNFYSLFNQHDCDSD